MKQLISALILTLLFATIFSCKNIEKEKLALQLQIDTLEQQLNSGKVEVLDYRLPLQLSQHMKDFARQFPKDSISAVYLFKASQIELNTGKSIEAIHTLDTLILLQPNHSIIPSAFLFKAFIYDDRLKDIDNSGKALDELIEKYPNADPKMIENAKAYKANLGKTPEQIIMEMEMAQKQDSIY